MCDSSTARFRSKKSCWSRHGYRLALLSALMAIPLAAPSFAADQSRKNRGREAAKKSAPRPKRRPPGVRGMFESAQELFDAGRYVDAVNAYEALLRRYPGYDVAILQLARSYYKLERFRDAAITFDRVNVNFLEPESGYEYGSTYYAVKTWDKALDGYKKVPPGHALYDLANYYAGICALKTKRYDESEDHFEKAVVLPDKLAKTRTIYLKHIQALRLIFQKNQLAREREAEKEALEQKNLPKKKIDVHPLPPMPPAPVTAIPPPTPEHHLGFRLTPKFAFAGFESERQVIDNFGTKRSQFKANVSTFDFGTGPKVVSSMVEDGQRKTGFGFFLGLNGEHRETSGNEQRIVIDEKNDDRQRILSQEQPPKYQRSGRWTANPWIEMPMPWGLWTALSAEASYKYPDLEKTNRTAYHRGVFELGGKSDTGLSGGGLQGYYQELINPKSQITTAVSGVKLGGFFELPSHLALSSTAGFEVYDYRKKDLTINGPDNLTTLEIAAVQGFPLGFTLKVAGLVEKSERFVFFDIPTFNTVVANGVATSGLVVLSLGPQLALGTYPFHVIATQPFVPYIQAQVTGLVRKTRWDLQNKEAREVFEYNVPDYIERVSGRVTLNLNF